MRRDGKPSLDGLGARVLALVLVSSFVFACGPSEPELVQRVDEAQVEVVRADWQSFVLIPVQPLPDLDARVGERVAAVLRGLRGREAALASTPGSVPTIEREGLERLIARTEGKARVSMQVRELATGAVVFEHEPELPLIPASNHKLVTAAAAIDLLGPDYVFETFVLVRGEVLYLVGSGDPSIDTQALAELARRVAPRLEHETLREMVVDASAFSARRLGPGYGPEDTFEGAKSGAAYLAPSGALSLNFNTVELAVEQPKEDDAGPDGGDEESGRADEPLRPRVRVLTASDHLRIDNRARVGAGPTALTLRPRSLVETVDELEVERTQLVLRGVLAQTDKGQTLRSRVIDPGLYAGEAFATQLARASHTRRLPVRYGQAPMDRLPVELSGAQLELPLVLPVDRDRQTAPVRLVGVLRSAPLHELVGRMLRYSNNFMAEQLLRTLGRELAEQPGDWEEGTAVLREYWRAIGNAPSQLHSINGSGFSEEGRLTSAGLSALLVAGARTQVAPTRLVDALPAAGSPGTLASRLAGTRGRVRAKTGTLGRASGLSGVIADSQGEARLAFSILVNSLDGGLSLQARRSLEDALARELLK